MMTREEIFDRIGMELMLSIAGYVGFCEGANKIDIESDDELCDIVFAVAQDFDADARSDNPKDTWTVIEDRTLHHARFHREEDKNE